VVGRQRVRRRDVRDVGIGEDLERLLAGAVVEDHAAEHAIATRTTRLCERAAQHRRETRRRVARIARETRAATDRPALTGARPDEALGVIDARDHALVRGAGVVSEGEETVVQKHQPFDSGVALEDLAASLASAKPGMMYGTIAQRGPNASRTMASASSAADW
jgi:hypothetical protein